MTEAAYWFVNTVDVEPKTGQSSSKAVFGAKRSGVSCWLEDKIQTVRDTEGRETTSTAQLFISLDDAADFPPGSRVTTPSRKAFVISVARFDSGSLDLELDHAVVTLT